MRFRRVRGSGGRATPLERRLGVKIRNRSLLEMALTHRSFAYEQGKVETNERLEFLGDAVLGIVVTDALYNEYPGLPEGDLAKMRAALVNMTVLADVAREVGLGEAVLLGRGEAMTGGRTKASILADTLEAVFGELDGRPLDPAVVGETLLVDADLRRPVQHTAFDVSRGPGLSEVLFPNGKNGQHYQEEVDQWLNRRMPREDGTSRERLERIDGGRVDHHRKVVAAYQLPSRLPEDADAEAYRGDLSVAFADFMEGTRGTLSVSWGRRMPRPGR